MTDARTDEPTNQTANQTAQDARPTLPLEGWSDIMRTDPSDARVLAVIAASAIGVDVAVRHRVDSISGALVFVVLAVGLLLTGRVQNRRAVPLLVLAAVFGACLAVRTSGALLGLDALAAAVLLAAGASMAKGGDPFDVTLPRLVARGLYLVAHGVLAPAFPFVGRRRPGGRQRTTTRWFGVVRGLLLAAPAVILIGALLASADAVFASFFTVDADLGDFAGHIVLLVVGAWIASALLRAASADAFAMPDVRWRPLGITEATTVLVSLAVLFAAFGAAQAVAAVRGAAYVERTAGLSYAEYARSGFFQLLAVAAIALAVIVTTNAATHVDDGVRRIVVLTEVVVGLTLVVVVVAIRRLFLYEAAYGLTLLRFWAVLFALWIGVVFVLVGLSVAGVAARRRWLTPATAVVGLAMLLAVNLVNVDRLIVERNVDRFAGTDKLDVVHLVTLSDDAVPTIIDALPSMRPVDGAYVRSGLCDQVDDRDGDEDGAWSWNASRSAARNARDDLCRA